MSSVVTKTVTLSLIALLSGPLAFAQSDDIWVERIAPVLQDSVLAVSVEVKNLFSPRITGTIQSGLPSIIQIEIRLEDDGGQEVAYKFISRQISYDIWEERYTVDGGDTVLVFSEFDSVMAFGRRLDLEALTPVAELDARQTYVVQVRAGIVPISTRQAERVSDWLLDPNQTEERIASEQRSSGFELNLNKLVSFFVNRNSKPDFASSWFSSRKFRIYDLSE